MLKTENMLKNLQEFGWYHQEGVFDTDFVKKALEDFTKRQFKEAGIGEVKSLDKSIRNDRICWLERYDLSQISKDYIGFMDNLSEELNKTFFIGAKDCEVHFAEYAPGGFYKAHYDNFKGKNKRLVTVITYLNEDWQDGDGGELVLHLPDGLKTIKPKAGTVIIFMASEIKHEVLPANKVRKSITGWIVNESNLLEKV